MATTNVFANNLNLDGSNTSSLPLGELSKLANLSDYNSLSSTSQWRSIPPEQMMPSETIVSPEERLWTYDPSRQDLLQPDEWPQLENFVDNPRQQSPINIDTNRFPAVDLQEVFGNNLIINYEPLVGDITIENLGFNGEVFVDTPSMDDAIYFNGKEYDLIEFHPHVKGEHTFDGANYELELHLEHRSADGEELILAVPITLGQKNETLQEVFFDPIQEFRPGEMEIPLEVEFNPENLFPNNLDGWYYRGSLTTPPGTEGVNWFVFENPIEVSFEQMVIYQQFLEDVSGYPFNNRPVQPLNGRELNPFVLGDGSNDFLRGGKSDQLIYGRDGNDTLRGGEGNDYLDGGKGNDQLFGGKGNDTLAGREGRDTLYGGPGDDVFRIFDSNDVIVEESGQKGNDTIEASIDYKLPDFIDTLELFGDAIKGRGNDADNTIIGNTKDNILYGEGGNDILYGGQGNDTLVGGKGFDVLIGVNPQNFKPGKGQQDVIIGSKDSVGAEKIVLGDTENVYYVGEGRADYALIQKFDLFGNSRDVIQLKGDASMYRLGSSQDNGTEIFLKQSGPDELIARIEGIGTSKLNLSASNQFTYV